MFSANAVLSEISANEQFLGTRQESPQLLQGLTQQLVHKISHMHGLTSNDAVKLFQTIEGSTLPDTMKESLQECLDSKLLPDGNQAGKVIVAQQQLDHLANYLTRHEWDQLHASGMYQGAHVLSQRLKLLGVQSLKESTKRIAVAILVTIQLTKDPKLPPYVEIYELAQHLLQVHAKCTLQVPAGVPVLANYPVEPQHLGPEAMKLCYGEESPEARYLERLPLLVAHHIPIRATSKLLYGTKYDKRPNKAQQPAQPAQQPVLQPGYQQPIGAVNHLGQQPGQCTQQGQLPAQQFGTFAQQTVAPHGVQHIQSQQDFAAHMAQWQASQQKLLQPASLALVPATAPTVAAASVPAAPGQASAPAPIGQPPNCPAASGQPASAPALTGQAASAGPSELVPLPEASTEGEKPTLADFTSKAFAVLKDRKAKNGGPTMKRPAAATAKTKAATPKTKAKTKKPATQAKRLGCIRCRGSVTGCSTCQKPNFQGLVLHGRDAWLKWHQSR